MVVVLAFVTVFVGGVATAAPRNMGYDGNITPQGFCARFLTDMERGRLNASPEQYRRAFEMAGYPFEDAHALSQFLGWAGLIQRLPTDAHFTVAYLDGDQIIWRTRFVKAGEWAVKDGSEPFNWLVLVPSGNVVRAQYPKLMPGPRVYLQAPSCEDRLVELERALAEIRQAAGPCEDTGARERIAALETEIAGLKERVAALEGRQDCDEEEILVLRDEISQLRQQVALLAQGLEEVRGEVQEIRTILPLEPSQPPQPAVVKKHHRNEWIPWLLGVGVGYLIFHNGGGGGPAPLPPNGPALPPN